MRKSQIEVKIPLNENKASKRTLGSILTLAVGLVLIIITTSGGETHTSGLVFGVLLAIAGVAQLISSIISMNATTDEFAIMINEEKIIINGRLFNKTEGVTLAISDCISAQTDVSESGKVTLYLKYRTEEMEEPDELFVDVELANIDYLTLKKCLNKLFAAQTEVEKIHVIHEIRAKSKSF